jgi:hypothetical protein
MNRLLIALTALALNGCALYDAYMMTGYDSNEYRIITEIRTDAGVYKDQCNSVVLQIFHPQKLSSLNFFPYIYSRFLTSSFTCH